MEVNKIISQHLLLPKRFIQMFGINPAVLLMELIDKELYHHKNNSLGIDGFFYHSKDCVFDNTALPRWKFDTARKKLEEQELILSKLGKWKKLHFKINNEKINQIFYPKNQEMWDLNLSLEPFMDESYIRYPIALAHTIWINETILIKDLLSKRTYFLKKWELRNGYFYNSVKNVQEDTTLTKKQQLKSIKKLNDLQLLSVQLGHDNTRYFCINVESLVEYEKIDIKKLLKRDESKKSTQVESKKSTQLVNPFDKLESEKSSLWESQNTTQVESKNSPDIKAESVPIRKENSESLESEKGRINNTKLKIPNNNIKEMKLLLSDFNFWNGFIDSVFKNFELLSIRASFVQFQELYFENSNISLIEKYSELLLKNESLVNKFYDFDIYDEKIIFESLINFSSKKITEIFEILISENSENPEQTLLGFLQKMVSRPFKNMTKTRAKKLTNSESFIELQAEEWIKNNIEDFCVLIQQEEMRLLEEDPLLEETTQIAEKIIREVIKKKFK